MINQPTKSKSGALPRFLRATCVAGLLPALVLLLSIQSSHAGSAKWKASPPTGDWNTAGNWTAGGPPNGSADTATFATSNRTGVSLSLNTEVNGIVFNAGASGFTITASPLLTLMLSGVGITNNSGINQNFVTATTTSTAGAILFNNSATAGSLTAFTNNGSAVNAASGGFIKFFTTSTAGSGTFINNGGTVSGAGGGFTEFANSATAGNGTFTNNGGAVSGANGGFMAFFDTSTASNGTFTTNGSAVSGAIGGFTQFLATSTAGSGTFTTNGSAVSGAFGGGFTQFFDSSTASSGTFTTNGGAVVGANHGHLDFDDTSTASNATLIANPGPGSAGDEAGGIIRFFSDSTGGTARVEVFGTGTGDTTNGNLDISFHNAPGVAIGSIEGSGAVFLGAVNLTVGSNNLSTAFSGVIQDGGQNGGSLGSFTKLGTGTLTLSGANTYTGGTTVSEGTLLITSRSGSGTGTGAVQVNTGTLGGTGKIAGNVTVGTGSGLGAFLSPGTTRTGTLTIQRRLVFNSDSTYNFELKTSNATADKVTAKGVTIRGALFSFLGIGTSTLTSGTVFTAINNTAATPIAGTFANLADGSTFTVGNNTFQANYEGGTGNDLTLTVQ